MEKGNTDGMCFVVCYFLKLDYFSIVLFVYFEHEIARKEQVN